MPVFTSFTSRSLSIEPYLYNLRKWQYIWWQAHKIFFSCISQLMFIIIIIIMTLLSSSSSSSINREALKKLIPAKHVKQCFFCCAKVLDKLKKHNLDILKPLEFNTIIKLLYIHVVWCSTKYVQSIIAICPHRQNIDIKSTLIKRIDKGALIFHQRLNYMHGNSMCCLLIGWFLVAVLSCISYNVHKYYFLLWNCLPVVQQRQSCVDHLLFFHHYLDHLKC